MSVEVSRWREAPRGIGYRRWTIASAGLRELFRMRLFVFLVSVAWGGGVMIAMLGFLVAQSIGSGGWLETLAQKIGPRAEAMVAAIGGMVVLYPEVCLGGLFTLIFWLHSFLALWVCFLALAVTVPRLVASDRATNALTVYLSRPLTSGDYLLGKLGTIAGILGLLWTGPLIFGWFFNLLLAPDRDFVIYAFAPFLRALEFNGLALVALAAIALGASAAHRSAAGATVIWMVLWVVAGFMAGLPDCPAWLRRASFSHDLGELRSVVFRLDGVLGDAKASIPMLGEQLAQTMDRAAARAQAVDGNGAALGLALLVVVSSAIFLRRLRPDP
jgi:ABC-2 type transport system permease protein